MHITVERTLFLLDLSTLEVTIYTWEGKEATLPSPTCAASLTPSGLRISLSRRVLRLSEKEMILTTIEPGLLASGDLDDPRRTCGHLEGCAWVSP